MVDIARSSDVIKKKKIRRALYGAAALAGHRPHHGRVSSRLKPAAPSVERAPVWIDTVKRGPMLRQVRGSGTLVPEGDPLDSRDHAGTGGAGVDPSGGRERDAHQRHPRAQQSRIGAARSATQRLGYQSAPGRVSESQGGAREQPAGAGVAIAGIEANYKNAVMDLQGRTKSSSEDKLVAELTVKVKRSQVEELKNRLADLEEQAARA